MQITVSALQKDSLPIAGKAVAFLVMATVICLASLLGILTRPMGFLAALWPANAILLGLMIRNPQYNSIWGWSGAVAGYLAADLLTGGEIGITLWLTAANLAGAGTGVFLYSVMTDEDRRLARPLSVLLLFFICIVSAMAAALVGGGAGPVLFGTSLLSGIEFWFVTELVNALVILPVILSFPGWSAALEKWLGADHANTTGYARVFPALTLVVTMFAGTVVDGPSAIAFPFPALLWCALTYSMFATALLSMVFCSWLLIATSIGLVNIDIPNELLTGTSSIRLGIAFIALGPLTAAAINTARVELLEKFSHAADHCSLTNALSRRAFMERAERMLGNPDRQARQSAVLMIDADKFKTINDRFGHAAGDEALVSISNSIGSALRTQDIYGRLGGEEFAVILPGVTSDEALAIADRIRSTIAETPAHFDGQDIPLSVSIGVAPTIKFPSANFEALLRHADEALYLAKEQGRNRVRSA